MDNKGYVYIISNTEYIGLLKIGKSKRNPVIRADQLTRNTGAIGIFKLEWFKEVLSMDIAESYLHFTFRKFHNQKEFFSIDIEKAKLIADSALSTLFELDIKLQTEMSDEEENIREPNIDEIEDMEKILLELEKELSNLEF
ncbi:MAG: GIY-YIG nuclease family protein [Bacteroidales bacterium]|nr:GIY-YIG nuclease family protein [Bacteroidales bacterium]